MKKIQIKNLKKYYGTNETIVKALDNLSLDILDGEFVAIMGSSGCGKSTLLNCIAAIDNVTSGNIFFDGEDITALNENKKSKFRREHLGFIFQEYNLLDSLNAYENIVLPLVIKGKKVSHNDTKILDIAEKLNIKDALNRYPNQLSGGQKQRIAISRALINEPKLILADEPTGALDSKTGKSILDSLKTINEEYSSTIMMVTHDAFAASYASRVVFLKDGEVFNVLNKNEKPRKEFYFDILNVISVLGGEIDE